MKLMRKIRNKIKRMPEEHPDFPLYLSIAAFLASFVKPIIYRILGITIP